MRDRTHSQEIRRSGIEKRARCHGPHAMRARSLLKIAACLLSATALSPTGTWAQTVPSFENDPGVTVLDPIIITGRRRSEDVQDVPISTNVIEGEQLRDISPISSNADIARSTPNFSFVERGGIYANIGIIRGVGSLTPVSSDDTSVSYNVNEVPLSAFGLPPTTLDLERVEVLRGPQGTLYGRNAQAGAVNFVPNRPTFDREFRLRGEIGTNGWSLGEFIANTPLIQDVLAGRLAVQHSKRGGDVPNVVIGGKDGDVQIGAARGSLLFTPTDDTSALLTLNYNRYEDSIPLFILRDANCYPCSGVNPRFDVKSETYGADLRIEHAFENFRLTSVSSVHHTPIMDSSYDLVDALVYGALGLAPSNVNTPGADLSLSHGEETTYFQELRLSSLEGSAVTWTGGLNFARSELTVDGEGKNISPFFAAYSGQRHTNLTSNSYAVFGEATVPLVGSLKGLIGARLTHEDKDASYRYLGAGVPGTVASHAQDTSFSDTYFTGRVGLSYDWSDDFMTYATLSRGAVGGGFQYFPRNAPYGGDEKAFPTSTSLTYEVGFKATLWDGRATLNGAVFYNDVSKGHLVSRIPGTYNFDVAALDYESYGGEIEGRVQVTPELTLYGGLGYTHAELTNVPSNNSVGAVPGNRLPNVPAFNGHIGAEYRVAADRFGLTEGAFYANASYQYVGSRAADVENSFDLDAYGLVNTRLGWQGDRAEFYVFANNLFDERYEAYGISFGPTVRAGTGRTVGIGASVKF